MSTFPQGKHQIHFSLSRQEQIEKSCFALCRIEGFFEAFICVQATDGIHIIRFLRMGCADHN